VSYLANTQTDQQTKSGKNITSLTAVNIVHSINYPTLVCFVYRHFSCCQIALSSKLFLHCCCCL